VRQSLYAQPLQGVLAQCSEADEAGMAKIVSLVVKVGAVVFILALPQTYAVQLQLLGGIWIIQLLPAILLGLYTRSFNAPALFIGWAAGITARQ
jgi:SSS family solute:Na+ symporter